MRPHIDANVRTRVLLADRYNALATMEEIWFTLARLTDKVRLIFVALSSALCFSFPFFISLQLAHAHLHAACLAGYVFHNNLR